MLETKLTRMPEYPLSHLSGRHGLAGHHELAAAVSEAGGLGIIGRATLPDWVQTQIDELRKNR